MSGCKVKPNIFLFLIQSGKSHSHQTHIKSNPPSSSYELRVAPKHSNQIGLVKETQKKRKRWRMEQRRAQSQSKGF